MQKKDMAAIGHCGVFGVAGSIGECPEFIKLGNVRGIS